MVTIWQADSITDIEVITITSTINIKPIVKEIDQYITIVNYLTEIIIF